MSQPARTPSARVVIADDSGFMRRLIADALTKGGFDVVGQAKDGDEALALCTKLDPDVLSLDLAMPGLDGMGVLRELRRAASPIPVVVVSAFSPQYVRRAVDVLAEGAVDLVAKPATGEPLGVFFQQIAEKVGVAASSRRRGPQRPRVERPLAAPPGRAAAPAANRSGPGTKVVVIACSTGGPKALAELMPALPASLGAGTLLVQHMPPGFTASLADRLDGISRLTVREAQEGAALESGTALLAPGGKHMRLSGAGRVQLSDEEPVGGLRPRADLTIEDAALRYGRKLVLVVLTGMGNDGVAGARVVKKHGGRVLAEAEETCTVYGMPRAVAEAGLVDVVAPLHELPELIAREAA